MSASRILVTGASGFVGANLVRSLLAGGNDVHVMQRSIPSAAWRLRGLEPDLRFHQADLTDSSRVDAVVLKIRPEVIFHLANAGLYSGHGVADRQMMETNFFGTVNLLTSCRQVGYRLFVQTGSSSEYGPKPGVMTERDACEPINMYAIAKAAATHYAMAEAHQRRQPVTVFRLFSPFGPYDDPRRLMVYAVSRALSGLRLDLADPRSVRDYIHIDDVISLMLTAMTTVEPLLGRVFNVGSGIESTVEEVVTCVLKATSSRSEVVWNALPRRPWDTFSWRADISAITEVVDWRPSRSLPQGVADFGSWFQRHSELYAAAAGV